MLLRYLLTKIYILVVFLFNLSHHSEFKCLLLKHKKMQLTSEAISPISAVPDDLIATSLKAFQLFCPTKRLLKYLMWQYSRMLDVFTFFTMQCCPAPSMSLCVANPVFSWSYFSSFCMFLVGGHFSLHSFLKNLWPILKYWPEYCASFPILNSNNSSFFFLFFFLQVLQLFSTVLWSLQNCDLI